MTQLEEATASGRSLEQFQELVSRKYPKLAKDGITESSVALLPSGQLITLWKTLHHHFYEGCVQKLAEQKLNDQQRIYFKTMAEFFFEFLSCIRMMETSVSLPNIEKMTSIFATECLASLGASIVERKHDEDIVHWFLKLCYAWSELQGILLYYHGDKYEGAKPSIPTDPAAANLSCFIPTLTAKQWLTLEKQVKTFGKACCMKSFVELVGQKLKYLTAFEENRQHSEQQIALLETSTREASLYIWSSLHQGRGLDPTSMQLYGQIVGNMQASDIIEFVHRIVNQILPQPCCEKNLPSDSRFHYALAMETMDNLLRKIIKMKIQQKSLKQLRKEVFSISIREKLVAESAATDIPGTTEILQHLLELTNQLVESLQEPQSNVAALSEEDGTTEFSEELIVPYADLLFSLPIEQYSKELKTLAFLTVLNCAIAVSQQQNNERLLDLLVDILRRSSTSFAGNQFIFSINWVQLFKWFREGAAGFSYNSKCAVSEIVFQNVYVSTNAIEEFHEQFQFLLAFKLKATSAPIFLTLLGFLSKHFESRTKTKVKAKLTAQVRSHAEELMRVALNVLRKAQKSAVKTKDSNYISNMFHTSWRLIETFQLMKETETAKVTASSSTHSVDLDSFRSVFEYQADRAVHHLEERINTLQSEAVEGDIQKLFNADLPSRYALAFLRGICRANILQPGFILKLWKVYMELPVMEVETMFADIPHLAAGDIYAASNQEEFHEIAQLISTAVEIQTKEAGKMNEKKLSILAKLLQDLLDVELSAEKKTIRRQTLEAALYNCLPMFTAWTGTISSVSNVVIPFLQLFVCLVRRRNALCSTTTLSLCLAAITSAPLSEITDVSLYRKVFCIVGDLLNSFTMHRIDVLSFRNHIYLQCFQTLLESITEKADQKNNLTDEGILHLKYCAHSVERICQSMKLGQKEFSRISPYCVAMLIRQFELFTVYPPVKDSLLSGCYKLIDLCDDHGIAQLNSMFTVGSREIFKTVYNIYKKFYRYTGKV